MFVMEYCHENETILYKGQKMQFNVPGMTLTLRLSSPTSFDMKVPEETFNSPLPTHPLREIKGVEMLCCCILVKVQISRI